MIEQISLSLDEAKRVVVILKSGLLTSRAWEEVYAVFHNGQGLKNDQERTISYWMNGDSCRVTLAYEDGLEHMTFGLYDSKTKCQDNVTREEFLIIMNKYVTEMKKGGNKKRESGIKDKESERELRKRLEKVEHEVAQLREILKMHGICEKDGSDKLKKTKKM